MLFKLYGISPDFLKKTDKLINIFYVLITIFEKVKKQIKLGKKTIKKKQLKMEKKDNLKKNNLKWKKKTI